MLVFLRRTGGYSNKSTMTDRTALNHRHSGAQLWALFALIVYTPLPLASDRPWAIALLALLTGGLLLWVIWQPVGRTPAGVLKCAGIPLALLGLWMLLLLVQLMPVRALGISLSGNRALFDGATISLDAYFTRVYFAQACILTAVFWLVVTLVNSRQKMEQLVRVFVFSGLLQALIGVVLMSTGTTFELFFTPMRDARAHGSFVSPNNLAGYLELTLAVGIGLMIAKLDGRASRNWRHRLHGWIGLLLSGKAMLRLSLIIMVVGLVASRSRMGNAAFFASLLVTGLLTLIVTKYGSQKSQGEGNTTRAMIVFITSLIVLDVVIIGGVVGVEKVVERIEYTNLQTQQVEPLVVEPAGPVAVKGPDVVKAPVVLGHRQEESVEHRSEVARASIPIVRDFLWAGTGGGTFQLAFPRYRPPEVTGFWDHAHNDYAEIACDTGLLGLLLLAALVLHSMYLSVRALARSGDQFVRGMAFGSLMGVVSLLIHAWVDFNFQSPAVAMLFLIVLCIPYVHVGLNRTSMRV